MEKNIEETTPQNPVVEETPEVIVDEVIVEDKKEEVLTPEQITELLKKADVSSQNFERAKKAEDKVKDLESQLEDNETLSDYDGEDVGQLKEKISAVEAELMQAKLVKKYPQLEDTWDDFTKYHEEDENQGMKLETAAKAFLVDKDLLGAKRKGLEKPSGGNKTPQPSGMSIEDIETIRKNDGPKYRDMLKKGQIKFKG